MKQLDDALRGESKMIAAGTYFYKDQCTKLYVLVRDGVKAGTVITKKEAKTWWKQQ